MFGRTLKVAAVILVTQLSSGCFCCCSEIGRPVSSCTSSARITRRTLVGRRHRSQARAQGRGHGEVRRGGSARVGAHRGAGGVLAGGAGGHGAERRSGDCQRGRPSGGLIHFGSRAEQGPSRRRRQRP